MGEGIGVYHSIQPVSMNFRLTYTGLQQQSRSVAVTTLGRLATTTAITMRAVCCAGSLISLDVLSLVTRCIPFIPIMPIKQFFFGLDPNTVQPYLAAVDRHSSLE